MALTVEQHELTILLDRAQVKPVDLTEVTRQVLRDYLGRIQVIVGLARSLHPLLTIKGTLEDVDLCHRELYQEVILRRKWNHYRLRSYGHSSMNA